VANQTNGKTSRFEVRPTAESHFSWLRTRMSTERTLMSWIRTATALIGFFTIVQFFERFNKMEGVSPAHHPQAPRYLGLMLIGAGILGSIITLWEYRKLVRYLWHAEFGPSPGSRIPPHTRWSRRLLSSYF
jgi:inner membrane protein YidH